MTWRSFELLRVNSNAQVRGRRSLAAAGADDPARAIAMLGLEGVRRAALARGPWSGPLDDTGAALLERLIERVKRAGHVALALRPAGYDAGWSTVTLLQNLGRLVVQYHFRGKRPDPPPHAAGARGGPASPTSRA